MLFIKFVVYFFTTELYKLPKLFPYVVVLIEVIGFQVFPDRLRRRTEATHFQYFIDMVVAAKLR